MIRVVSTILILFFAGALFCQPFVGITLSHDTIEPGDLVTMEVKLSSQSPLNKIKINYSPLDTIENIAMNEDNTLMNDGRVDVEWIDAPFVKPNETITIDVSRDSTGQYTLSQSLKFILWDIGAFRFPLPTYMTMQGDTMLVRSLQSPLLFSLIQDNIAPQDTTQLVHDIHDIVPEEKNWLDYLWLIIAITLCIAGLLIYLALRNRKQQEVSAIEILEPEISIPAHITALEKLQHLKTQRPWEQGKVKAFQEELTYTIREYLEGRFGIQALESTTNEIVEDLVKKDFDSAHESTLTRILQVADLVKFAKAEPTNETHEAFLKEAEQFVIETKEEETDDVE